MVAAAPAGAQQVQPWPDVLLTAPLGGSWLGSAEVVGRIAGDERASQLETRLQIGHQLNKTTAVWVGWVHIASYVPNSPTTAEDQAVEQLNWTPGSLGRLRLMTRTRLEQRFLTQVNGVNWRLREQLRGVLPLGSKTAPSAVLWTEPFVALNRTAGQQRTLDQLRSFVGVNFPLSPRAEFEVGYLNQRLYRARTTLVNHAVPLVLTYRF